jgi:hypothetical protein
MPDEPILRGTQRRRNSIYPIGEIPHSIIVEIGKQIVHRLAVGQVDITGDDFGAIFANAISGQHRARPLGIADVEWNDCAWSVKTVKDKSPFTQTRIRAISGRNSPNYSSGISDPDSDIQATGRAVLEVWNARVNESLNEHDDLRIVIMVRNMDTLEFVLMEHEAVRFIPTNYTWEKNSKGNFEAYNSTTRTHCFTWQPHGSQFTIIHHVPASAHCFRITRRPGMIEARHVLNLIQYDDSWIEAVPRPTQF